MTIAVLLAAAGWAASSTLAGPGPELARQLAAIGRYDACAVEFLRHGFEHPNDLAPAMERAALCLQRGGRDADARDLMRRACDRFGGAAGAPGFLRLRLGLACVAAGGGLDPRCLPGDETSRTAWLADAAGRRSLYLPVMDANLNGSWSQARARVAAWPEEEADSVLASWRREDRAFAERGVALPRKSAWTAAALSAVIPGLGKGYLGRWGDATFAFLSIILPAVGSTLGFQEDGVESGRGWLLGSLAAVFHAGNVYGSAVGSRVANRDADAALRNEVRHAYRGRLDP